MRVLGVIPARFGARRFPGKPLAPIAGRPLVRWVWEGARGAKRLDRLVVATEDPRIVEACRGFGAEAVLTSAEHPTGTHRAAEAAARSGAEIVVNIQGDEPLIEGQAIDAVVAALEEDPEVPMATLAHPAEADALDDPNRVKVVLDRAGFALYFSRSPIPARHAPGAAPPLWQHAGLYAYRSDFLAHFLELAPTPAEQAESLEQLRALEHGYRIRVVTVEGWRSAPVDVPEDVARVEAVLKEPGRC